MLLLRLIDIHFVKAVFSGNVSCDASWILLSWDRPVNSDLTGNSSSSCVIDAPNIFTAPLTVHIGYYMLFSFTTTVFTHSASGLPQMFSYYKGFWPSTIYFLILIFHFQDNNIKHKVNNKSFCSRCEGAFVCVFS